MNPKVRLVVAFMKSNLHRELSLDELGAVVGLSHSRLESLFKAELSNPAS
jgi:transcriptional regulator GlxA family with amidase domain